MYIHGMRELANLHYHPMVRSAGRESPDAVCAPVRAQVDSLHSYSFGVFGGSICRWRGLAEEARHCDCAVAINQGV